MKYNPNIHHRRSVRLRGYDYGKEGMYFITICTQNRIHFFGEVKNGEMILNHFGEIAHREWEKLPERWPHVELGAFQIMPNHMHGVLLVGRPISAITTVVNGEDTDRGSMDQAATCGATTNRATTNRATTNRATTNRATTNRATTNRATTRVAPTTNHGVGTVGATLVVAPHMVAPHIVAPHIVAPDKNITPNPTDLSSLPPEIPFSKIQWATRPYLGQIIGAYLSIVATECLKFHKQNQPGVWLDKIWQRSFDERIIRDTAAFDNISNYIINNPANWKEDKFFD